MHIYKTLNGLAFKILDCRQLGEPSVFSSWWASNEVPYFHPQEEEIVFCAVNSHYYERKCEYHYRAQLQKKRQQWVPGRTVNLWLGGGKYQHQLNWHFPSKDWRCTMQSMPWCCIDWRAWWKVDVTKRPGLLWHIHIFQNRLPLQPSEFLHMTFLSHKESLGRKTDHCQILILTMC